MNAETTTPSHPRWTLPAEADGSVMKPRRRPNADRMYALVLLLESVGLDAAVRLGPPELWREAIDEIYGRK